MVVVVVVVVTVVRMLVVVVVSVLLVTAASELAVKTLLHLQATVNHILSVLRVVSLEWISYIRHVNLWINTFFWMGIGSNQTKQPLTPPAKPHCVTKQTETGHQGTLHEKR